MEYIKLYEDFINTDEYLININKDWNNYDLKNYDLKIYPIQIVQRGRGLTSKRENFTLKMMDNIYKKYIYMVLIDGDKKKYKSNFNVPNYRNREINYNYPILNFSAKPHYFITLADTNIKPKVFNKLEDYPISSSKVKFSQSFNNEFFLPKTVFNIKDIKQLKLPIIAKPDKGCSARGIEKFKTYEEAEQSTLKFALWCEAKDLIREFRVFILNNNIIHLSERVTNFDHNMSVGIKKPNERIDLVYLDQKIDGFPYMNQIINIKNIISKKVKLDFYVIDLMLDRDNKLWVPEINGAPGIGPSIFCDMYEPYVKFAYNKKISDTIKNELKLIKDEYIYKMHQTYIKEYKYSLNPE